MAFLPASEQIARRLLTVAKGTDRGRCEQTWQHAQVFICKQNPKNMSCDLNVNIGDTENLP